MSREKMPPSCYPDPSKRNRPMYAEQCPQSPQSSQCPQSSQGPQSAQSSQFSQNPQGPALPKEYLRSKKLLRRTPTSCPCGSNPCTSRGARPLSMEVTRDKCTAAEQNRLQQDTVCDKYRSSSAEGRPFDPCNFKSYPAPASLITLTGRPLNIEMEMERGRKIAMHKKRPPSPHKTRPQDYNQTSRLMSDSRFAALSNARAEPYGSTRSQRERAIARITPGSGFEPPPPMANTSDGRSPQWISRSAHTSPIRQRTDVNYNSSFPSTSGGGGGGGTITRTTVTTTTTRTLPPQSPHYYADDNLLAQQEQLRTPNIPRQSKHLMPSETGPQTNLKVPTQSMFGTSPPSNANAYEGMVSKQFIPCETGPQTNLKVPTQSMFASSQPSNASPYQGMLFQNELQCPTECVEPEKLPLAESTRCDMTDDHKFNSRSVIAPPRQDSVQPCDSPTPTQRQPEPASKEQVTPECSRTPIPAVQCASPTRESPKDKNETEKETETEKCYPESKQPSKPYLSPKASQILTGQNINVDYDTFASCLQGQMGIAQSTRLGGNESDRNPMSLSNEAGLSDTQQLALLGPSGPPQDMSFLAILRYLADRLRSTFDYLSSFVKSQNPLETSTANRETFSGGPARQPGTWQQSQRNPCPMAQTPPTYTWENEAFDIRNRIAESLCNRNADYSSRPFANTSRKTDVLAQSARECAEAKRCGRIPFDSSDKHEAQKSSQLSSTRKSQIENLVLDTYCPGIIQETVDGVEDFNETSFNLSYRPEDDNICNNTEVAEPMTLLEAFSLRVDHDRKDLDQKIPENATEPDIADIVNTHYAAMNPTDMNRSIKGFLFSERQMELDQMNSAHSSPFNADVERKTLDIVLFDSPFKLVTYIGQTKVASE